MTSVEYEQPLNRRRLLGSAAACLLLGAAPLQAKTVRIYPVLSNTHRIIISPVIADLEPSQSTRRALNRVAYPGTQRPLAAFAGQPPRAYVRTGNLHGVAPWLLYGVALQESKLKFGQRALPYPWTLCVRGQPKRFASDIQTSAALRHYLGSATNIDCGVMQVNWHWHRDKLGSIDRAVDPYHNLAVGAQILRSHFDERGDWRQAVALYHTGSDQYAEQQARGASYARSTLARLSALGLNVPRLLQGGASHA